jgi:predicted TPR repeat methyltransferase
MNPKQRFRCAERATCRACGGSALTEYLDLGAQPPSNSFPTPAEAPTEQRFPLRVALCTDCGMSQLRDVVASEDIFDDYAYLSSTSGALRRHYQGMVDALLADYAPADGAVIGDIGCNDGITLKCYPAGRYALVGIDPSSAGAYAREAGFDVVEAFFDEALGTKLAAERGPAALITATNVVAHVDDIASLFAGVRNWLAADGVFVAEFPYLLETVDHLYFDTIYHEHLSYLALTPLAALFDRIGLKAIAVSQQEIGASGPAIRLAVARADSPRPVDDSIPAIVILRAASQRCAKTCWP